MSCATCARVSALAAERLEERHASTPGGRVLTGVELGADLGYRRGWNAKGAEIQRALEERRTLAGLRELRSAPVIETRELFSAEWVEGEWET